MRSRGRAAARAFGGGGHEKAARPRGAHAAETIGAGGGAAAQLFFLALRKPSTISACFSVWPLS